MGLFGLLARPAPQLGLHNMLELRCGPWLLFVVIRWVDAAVKKFNAQEDRILGYFERTGCMLAADGSKDHTIKLEGLGQDYNYMEDPSAAKTQWKTM